MDKPVAIVTGSASGVGAATALKLAQRGWNVVINYSKSEKEAQETQAACQSAGAHTLLAKGNVASDDDCRAIAAAAVQRWNRIDALVNNAGTSVFGEDAKWDNIDAEVFQRILAVNTLGTFQMLRACLPQLKAAKGAVVNVSSVAGALGIGSSVPYVASKGAVNSLTLHFARQLAPDIRVNAVCPALITSPWFDKGMGEGGLEKAIAATEAHTPLRKPSTPEDVAEAIVFLIVGAPTITGELLMIDGGTHLGTRR
ncbi:SDR family NAD(P)-dependent oxidoreductase [Ramlibacter sp. PS4R-6]|uniref:SDR family NAD(P)-dependent oxidoreductase n=1 Tax=Ramlibacter sp. PS4R-6 TaxID=3133438 RepID=UPI0030981CE3